METFGLARIEQRQDVRVVEPGGDLDFASEAAGTELGDQLGAKDLDRYLAPVLEVIGEVHRRHPTAAELPLHRVPVREPAGDLLQLLR
jgi:hypothetical protein